MSAPTVGEALIAALERRGVDTVFGIPGVHTIELYRGLAASRIRHVTPRHEQAAGFMADGYARACGRPGVAFTITGPGLTNALTAIAQARADSVPMLVVSSVNARPLLGLGRGYLHELPDQRATLSTVALASLRVDRPDGLDAAVDEAFRLMTAGRPGPVHLEIPMDVLALPAQRAAGAVPRAPSRPAADLGAALARLEAARKPVIIAGGGARTAAADLARLACALDAPVVETVNGRGLMHGDPLVVPASPSLAAVRRLVADADVVLAIGTEFGPTDFDMYAVGGFPALAGLVRVDIDADQLGRGPAGLLVQADAALAAAFLADRLERRSHDGALRDGALRDGAARAAAARAEAFAELPEPYRRQVGLLGTLRATLPGALVIGDSTQPVYAGNLYHDHDVPGGWFNSATGYGALGYALPAAIGAALAAPERPVVAITGDGGLQFCLAELGTARDAGVNLVVLVWNNGGYREIETSMREAGVTPVGVSPTPPDFLAVAAAYGLSAWRLDGPDALAPALARARALGGPVLIDLPEAAMLA